MIVSQTHDKDNNSKHKPSKRTKQESDVYSGEFHTDSRNTIEGRKCIFDRFASHMSGKSESWQSVSDCRCNFPDSWSILVGDIIAWGW